MQNPAPLLKICDKASPGNDSTNWANVADEVLVGLTLSGESQAFDFLFRRYRKQIMSVCLKRTYGDMAQALDLCQETFLSAFSHLNELKEPSKFFYWVLSIATNKCVTHTRNQRRYSKLLGEYEVLKTALLDNNHQWTDAELELVTDLINKIDNPDLRTTVQLFYIEGKKTAEIAELQGHSQTTITTRLNRFRIKFRRRIIRESLRD